MWGDEEREDTEKGINEKDGVEHENERREEGIRNGVRGEELRDGEGEQLQGAGGEEKEEAKPQDESAEEERVIEGQTREEGDSQEVLHQSISIETTTPSDRQEEERVESSDWSEVTAAERSQENTADTCTSGDHNTHGHEENTHGYLPLQEIHTPLLENTHRSQENTHPADGDTCASQNTQASSTSVNKNLSDLSEHTSSAPPGEDNQTPQSETVN